ncbi:hypothetical protein D3C84_1097680 [compost metagenome]
MRHRKVDLQQGAVADLARIEGHLDGLRMTSITVADMLVLRRIGCTAGITGDRILHAFDMLEHPLDAPEAASGEHCGFAASLGGFVEGRRRNNDRLFSPPKGEGRALADDAGSGQPQ